MGVPARLSFLRCIISLPKKPAEMKFYIVTPCYNALDWLKNCIRSVADQAEEGVEVHHHIQDGLSKDGTQAWLEQWQREHADTPGYTFTYESAKDAGMYDAINTAWSKLPADADVTAHLNSDEQYLPHALKSVAEQFLQHPAADILETTYLVTDCEGNYHCHRRPVQPHCWTSMRNCELMTCSTFHRAEPFRRHGIRFDTRFRVYGDVVFFRDLLCAGIRVETTPQMLTTAFAMTGHNMAWTHIGGHEARFLDQMTPRLLLLLEPISRRFSNGCRILVDMLNPPLPPVYQIYPCGGKTRCEKAILTPTCRWVLPLS